jgi:hypothetical protein
VSKPYGRISLSAVILLALVAAGLYAVILLAPVYSDNFDVQEAVAVTFNQLGKLNDHQARQLIRGRLSHVGTHEEYDLYGNLKTVPGLELPDENILIERNSVTGQGLVRVNYERQVYAKLIKRTFRLKFKAEKSGPILK